MWVIVPQPYQPNQYYVMVFSLVPGEVALGHPINDYLIGSSVRLD